jgi:hypothetical protein
MKANLLGILLLSTLCSSCCSIICGDEKTVNVKSNPSAAEFEVIGHDGNVVVKGTTPTNITLKRGGGYFTKGDYKINFHREGYEDLTIPINQGLETGWYIGGNIVFGGLLGILIIDPLTGAMWTIEDVDVSLNPLAEKKVESQAGKIQIQKRKIIGYRARRDPATGKYVTYPVYEDENK